LTDSIEIVQSTEPCIIPAYDPPPTGGTTNIIGAELTTLAANPVLADTITDSNPVYNNRKLDTNNVKPPTYWLKKITIPRKLMPLLHFLVKNEFFGLWNFTWLSAAGAQSITYNFFWIRFQHYRIRYLKLINLNQSTLSEILPGFSIKDLDSEGENMNLRLFNMNMLEQRAWHEIAFNKGFFLPGILQAENGAWGPQSGEELLYQLQLSFNYIPNSYFEYSKLSYKRRYYIVYKYKKLPTKSAPNGAGRE
jgi:hypothetical protein